MALWAFTDGFDRIQMSYLDAAAWLAVILCYAVYLSTETPAVYTDDCQVYDRLGRGIGCEAEDLTDRFIPESRREQ